jgi:hypothetical protein
LGRGQHSKSVGLSSAQRAELGMDYQHTQARAFGSEVHNCSGTVFVADIVWQGRSEVCHSVDGSASMLRSCRCYEHPDCLDCASGNCLRAASSICWEEMLSKDAQNRRASVAGKSAARANSGLQVEKPSCEHIMIVLSLDTACIVTTMIVRSSSK